MDVIYAIVIFVLALLFIFSPFMINSAYATNGSPKVVRTSTIFTSFISSVSLGIFGYTVSLMNNWCGTLTNGSSSFWGWYYLDPVPYNELQAQRNQLNANVDVFGCLPPLWSEYDNAIVIATITSLTGILITVKQFKKFKSATNTVTGLYLTASMLVLSLVYVVTAFAIIQFIFKILFGSSNNKN